MCWQQHGGSGAGITYGDVMAMPVSEHRWWIERIAKQREDEVQAISRAARG